MVASKVVLGHDLVERLTADARFFGGASDISSVPLQETFKVFLVGNLEEVLPRGRAIGVPSGNDPTFLRNLLNSGREIGEIDLFELAECESVLEDIPEFSDVSRPIVGL